MLKLAIKMLCETGNAPNAEKLQKVRNQGRPNDLLGNRTDPLPTRRDNHMTAGRLKFRDGVLAGRPTIEWEFEEC